VEGKLKIKGGSNWIRMRRNNSAPDYTSLDITKATLTLDLSSLPVTTNGRRRLDDDTERGILWLDSFDCDSAISSWRDYLREDDKIIIQIQDIPFGADPACADPDAWGTCCWNEWPFCTSCTCETCHEGLKGCFSLDTCNQRWEDSECPCIEGCTNPSQCVGDTYVGERATPGGPPGVEIKHPNRPPKKSNIERQNFWEGYTNDT